MLVVVVLVVVLMVVVVAGVGSGTGSGGGGCSGGSDGGGRGWWGLAVAAAAGRSLVVVRAETSRAYWSEGTRRG